MAIHDKLSILIILAATIALPASAAPHAQQQMQIPNDLNALYQSVYKLTQSPPPKWHLIRVCEVKTHDMYVTFVGVKKHKALIAAFTRKPLSEPSQDITLAPLYVLIHGLPQPRAYDPRAKGATMDWGYIFDRNKHGRIDYLAYLESARAVSPAHYPGQLPSIVGHITGKAMKLAIANTHMVFWHSIDLQGGSKSKALIMPMEDKRTGWIDATMLLLKSRRHKNDWQCSYFEGSALLDPKPCVKQGNEYVIPAKKILGIRPIPPKFDHLKLINEAAGRCGFGPDSFYQTPPAVYKALADSR